MDKRRADALAVLRAGGEAPGYLLIRGDKRTLELLVHTFSACTKLGMNRSRRCLVLGPEFVKHRWDSTLLPIRALAERMGLETAGGDPG